MQFFTECCEIDGSWVTICKPQTGKLVYVCFIAFGTMFSMLIFSPAFRSYFISHADFCEKVMSHEKCDILGGHMILYRIYSGMILYFFFLAFCNCQISLCSTYGTLFENGLWFPKLNLFCIVLLLSILIPEGPGRLLMHIGWIVAFMFLLFQLFLMIDLARALNTFWVERMEVSSKPTLWYSVLLLLTSVAYTVSGTLVIYFYFVYTSVDGCQTNKFFIALSTILCFISSVISIHPRIRETGLLQAGIVCCYTTYLMWSALSHSPELKCNPSWNTVAVKELNLHLEPEMFLDLGIMYLLLVYGIVRVSSVSKFLGSLHFVGCYSTDADIEDREQNSFTEKQDEQLLKSDYLAFYMFLISASLYSLMVISDFYTPEGVIGTESEVLETEDGLLDMNEYIKETSQWAVVCIKMSVSITFTLMYIWTVLAPVVQPLITR